MNNWQRLEQVIKWTGMSTNAFALAIGLKRSENLYQIKRGSFGISKELARLITLKYPIINRSWLLTGDGEMMLNSNSRPTPEAVIASLPGAIPFYQTDIVSLSNDAAKPIFHIVLPMFKGATFAAATSGNAMNPTIPSGSIVVLRECTVASILPGESYMIVTNDYVVLRRIRLIEGSSDDITLVADNNQKYGDMSISKRQINKLYLVIGIITNNQM